MATRRVREDLDRIQSKRRLRARQLQLHRSAESRRAARARAIEAEVSVPSTSKNDANVSKVTRDAGNRWKKQLCLHEWMVSLPMAMAKSWRVAPRLEGPRCVLVVRRRGWMEAWDARGKPLGSWKTALPAKTVLDAVQELHPKMDDASKDARILSNATSTKRWMVMDVLCWRGQSLLDCSAALRHFWIESRLQELQGESLVEGGDLQGAPWMHADKDGVTSALHMAQDGLIFIHEDARYDPGERTPLVLRWKDAGCSRFVCDTDAEGRVPDECVVTLNVDAEGRVHADGEPMRTLAIFQDPLAIDNTLQIDPSSQTPRKSTKGRLVRFVIHSLEWQDGEVLSAGLEPLGYAGKGRERADDITKVIFQFNARHDPISRLQLLDAASNMGEEQEVEQEDMIDSSDILMTKELTDHSEDQINDLEEQHISHTFVHT